MELTKSEIITLTVILEDKIKEWVQLVHNFPELHEHFNVTELKTIKSKINEGIKAVLQ
jgi:hypothetical protein